VRHLKPFKITETKIFDNYNDLIQHVEKYLDNVYVQRSSQWKKKLQEIVDVDGSFRGIGYSLNSLIEDVQKDKVNLENFLEDIKSHIRDFDKIFQKSGTLSDKDDKAYDEIERLGDRVDSYLEFIEQYLEDLESLARSYINIDDKLSYLMRLDFKNF